MRALAVLAAPVIAALACVPALAATEKGAGTQNRQWVAGPASGPPPMESPAASQVSETDDRFMHAREGTPLSYNLYLPVKAPVGPCLLIREGYGKASGNSQAEDFASRGYAVVDADDRGNNSSGGHWQPFSREEAEDGYDMIEWMARQPWCNGRIGTFGTSYMGIVQMTAAKLLPPHLKAMIPVQMWGDAYDGYYYPGGWAKNTDGWIYEIGAAQLPHYRPPSTGDPDVFMEHLLNEPSGVRFAQEVRQHPDRDGFWRIASSYARDHVNLARRGVAVMFQTGWNDLMTEPTLQAAEEFAAGGGPRMTVVGPWTHGAEDGVQPYDFQTMRVLWFDRFLKGIRNGIDTWPRALLYVPGPNQWRFEDDWPIPDEASTKLYLDPAKSGSAQSPNDGTLAKAAPAAKSPPTTYDYVPADAIGPATLFANEQGQEAGGSAPDQRPFEPLRMTWTTAPLKKATEVTGTVTVDFWASSTIGDPYFAARLVDVAPDGSALQIARGWLSAAHYPSDAHPVALKPGEVRRLRVRVWPTSNVFAAGHRIRVELGGSDAPLMEVNPQPHTDTIYTDATHPSRVMLPVIGTGL
jgi:putative CocE/NonD family hydrolase